MTVTAVGQRLKKPFPFSRRGVFNPFIFSPTFSPVFFRAPTLFLFLWPFINLHIVTCVSICKHYGFLNKVGFFSFPDAHFLLCTIRRLSL
jgi:hypothetical protein